MKKQTQFRETKQRNAIRAALEATGRPLSPLEILELAGKEVPRLGIATVYRNIRSMVESNELVSVDLPGQPARFTLPEHKNDHVFVDIPSNEVYTFQAPVSALQKLLPRGFKADTVSLYATGTVGVMAKRATAKAAAETVTVSAPAPAPKKAAKKAAKKAGKKAAKKAGKKAAKKATKKAARKGARKRAS
ncbi:MAG: transcriptional repressor [Opitutales bacterium]|nr:transcriptional repressor [Opitutales bacterium]